MYIHVIHLFQFQFHLHLDKIRIIQIYAPRNFELAVFSH